MKVNSILIEKWKKERSLLSFFSPHTEVHITTVPLSIVQIDNDKDRDNEINRWVANWAKKASTYGWRILQSTRDVKDIEKEFPEWNE